MKKKYLASLAVVLPAVFLSSSNGYCGFENLPEELVNCVVSFLCDAPSLGRVSRVNRELNRFAGERVSRIVQNILNQYSDFGSGSVREAAARGDFRAVKLFLHLGSDIDDQSQNHGFDYGSTALIKAIQNNDTQMAVFLLNSGANPNASVQQYNIRRALEFALKAKNLEVSELLIRKGALITEYTNLLEGLRGSLARAHSFIQAVHDVGGNLDEMLRAAAGDGNISLEAFQLLVQMGAKIDSVFAGDQVFDRLFVFHRLFKDRSEPSQEKLAYLIEQGAKVPSSVILELFAYGLSPDYSDSEILRLVNLYLSQGGDVDLMNEKEETLLHRAVSEGNLEIAKALVENGANLNALDNQGASIFHKSVFSEKLEMFKLVASLGIDQRVLDNRGRTVLDLLESGRHQVLLAGWDHISFGPAMGASFYDCAKEYLKNLF